MASINEIVEAIHAACRQAAIPEAKGGLGEDLAYQVLLRLLGDFGKAAKRRYAAMEWERPIIVGLGLEACIG
jgi:hypothetical protein